MQRGYSGDSEGGEKMSKTDEQIKKELFGAVGKVNKALVTGEIEINDMLKPFEWPRAVVYLACNGCKFIVEINRTLADKLHRNFNIPKPESYDSYYFEVDGCLLCDDRYSGVKFKRIKGLR